MSTDELAADFEGDDINSRAGSDDSEPVRDGSRATRSGGVRPSRSTNLRQRKHIDGYNDIDEMSNEDDASGSGDEWDSDKNDDEDEHMPDADDEISEPSDQMEDDDFVQRPPAGSLVVRLKMPKYALDAERYTPPTSPPSMLDDAATPKVMAEASLGPDARKSSADSTTNGVVHDNSSHVESAQRHFAESGSSLPADANSHHPDPQVVNSAAPSAQKAQYTTSSTLQDAVNGSNSRSLPASLAVPMASESGSY